MVWSRDVKIQSIRNTKCIINLDVQHVKTNRRVLSCFTSVLICFTSNYSCFYKLELRGFFVKQTNLCKCLFYCLLFVVSQFEWVNKHFIDLVSSGQR